MKNKCQQRKLIGYLIFFLTFIVLSTHFGYNIVKYKMRNSGSTGLFDCHIEAKQVSLKKLRNSHKNKLSLSLLFPLVLPANCHYLSSFSVSFKNYKKGKIFANRLE